MNADLVLAIIYLIESVNNNVYVKHICHRRCLNPNKRGGHHTHNVGKSQLARACGVPVGRRSGGRLATTLVATINDIFFSSFCPALTKLALDLHVNFCPSVRLSVCLFVCLSVFPVFFSRRLIG